MKKLNMGLTKTPQKLSVKVLYQWYLVTVRKGNEEKVAAEIKKWENYPAYIRDLKIVPEWAGYLLCQCSSVPEVERFFYHLNRNTNLRIGRFLPQPVSPLMVKNLLAKIQARQKTRDTKLATSSTDFKVGDLVKINLVEVGKKGINEGMPVYQEGRITYLNKRSRKVNIRTEDLGVEIVGIPLASCQKVLD